VTVRFITPGQEKPYIQTKYTSNKWPFSNAKAVCPSSRSNHVSEENRPQQFQFDLNRLPSGNV